jgi:hypothetical protein
LRSFSLTSSPFSSLKPSTSAATAAYPTQLYIGDEIKSWQEIGFLVNPKGVIQLGEMTIHLCGKSQGRGVLGWNFHGIPPDVTNIDGIPIMKPQQHSENLISGVQHPNGVQLIDHLVIKSKNYLQTEAVFKSIGIPLKRRSEDRDKKMVYSFYRPSKTILEVLSPLVVEDVSSESKVMGITFACSDLMATHSLLSSVTKSPWAAVQKHRQITTLNKELLDADGENRFSIRIAFMSPHVKQ